MAQSMETMSQKIAGGRNYLVTSHSVSKQSELLAVCFGYRGTDISPTGFGVSFLTGLGYDVVYVAQKKKTSYQGLAAEQLADAVMPVAAGRHVVTYGASLGGYCALYYAGVMNARALSLSPQNHQHPIYDRLKKADPKHPWSHVAALEDLPISNQTHTIVYDPLITHDAGFVNKWVKPAYPRFEEVHVPRAGHGAAAKLSAAGKLKDVVLRFLSREAQPPVIKAYLPTSLEGMRYALQDHLEANDRVSVRKTAYALVDMETSPRELKRLWRVAVEMRSQDLKAKVVAAITAKHLEDDPHCKAVLSIAGRHRINRPE